MTASLEFEDGVLALMACGLVLFLPWSLWRWFSPTRRKRLDRLEAADIYIRSRCRVCGGSIEFPLHGLGEWIECPHCNVTIQLQKLGTIQQIRSWARGCWSQRPGFNWKWASVLLVGAMICVTALFIYFEHRAELSQKGFIFPCPASSVRTPPV